MLDIHSAAASSQHNVRGLERVSSLAGGALMFSKGLRHGGLVGLLQMVVGGLAVARGMSGHCSTKAWWQRHRPGVSAVACRYRAQRSGAGGVEGQRQGGDAWGDGDREGSVG